MERGRQALLLERSVEFGAISSEGARITAVIILFSCHPGPVAGCLCSLMFFFLRKKKKTLWELKQNKNAKN